MKLRRIVNDASHHVGQKQKYSVAISVNISPVFIFVRRRDLTTETTKADNIDSVDPLLTRKKSNVTDPFQANQDP